MLLSKSITVLTAALLSGSHGGIGLVQASPGPVTALGEEEVIEGVSLESDRVLKVGRVSLDTEFS